MNTNWPDPKPVIAALVRLARKTGDRTRDLEPKTIDRLIQWMSLYSKDQEILEANIKYLENVIPMSDQEENLIFGESLPTGIMLHEKEHKSVQ